jgi:hypothetical protein
MDASENLGVLLTSKVTLVTQLTSRELVLQEKRAFITKQPYLKESYYLNEQKNSRNVWSVPLSKPTFNLSGSRGYIPLLK